MGSSPEFVNGKLKAVAGIKVRRALRTQTQESWALGLAVLLTSYGDPGWASYIIP